MVQESRRTLLGMAAVALMGLSACGTARSSTEVEDAWLARVPREQLGGVEAARAEQRQAQDEVTRAEVAVRDAERELEVTRREADAARSRWEADKASLDAARARGQQEGIDRAQASLRTSEAELAAAQAQVDWRRKAVDAEKARRQLEERRVEVADAQLSLAEYQALRDSGDVRAQQLAEGDFHAALARAESRRADAERRVQSQAEQEQQARAQWEDLRDQAYGGSGQFPWEQ